MNIRKRTLDKKRVDSLKKAITPVQVKQEETKVEKPVLVNEVKKIKKK